jgi:hypothetical protein
VIPGAGILSSITARFYDIGARSEDEIMPPNEEQTPLLAPERYQENEEAVPPVKKTGRWIARNAVIVFATALILSVIIGLCVFFGGMFQKNCYYMATY